MKLSIIIPCYNESKNIPLVLSKFGEVIQREDIELIVVDNGSTDNTAEVTAELLPKYSFAKYVHVPVNQGYGYGILSGLQQAQGTYIGWTHADLQTDPSDVIKALDIIESQEEPMIYVKGERKGRPFFDQFFTSGMSLFESLYLGEKLHDINAQPNIFHRDFFKQWENPPHDFSLDLYALYLAKKLKIKLVRFDVIFPERVHGTSSWNTGFAAKKKFIKRTLEFSKKLKKSLN
ncbi:glycosyltransferase family 2 protein [Zeaxanthinibacter enoshimensis]|uniref:Glycosyltransferase involved in cell wall biosynthesis n=1 Tax=Zeaxanthinibacter enoshimensis TaxID=392009 RepID=A0A4R6TMM9_9FLAO|nr:glycosyltransferase family 2 protein [Zeaxanthinibacter enoshimensis]TDQ32772.1 glycosyltransferase involved in cell wall biosynthesis [Zeaxanthinibacter enoshimensis]